MIKSKLNWQQDLERYAFIMGYEQAHDNPRDVLHFESLYDGNDKTGFGVGLVRGPLTGGLSYRFYCFEEDGPSIFGMGGEDDKEFAKSACEFEYLRRTGKIEHPFEDKLTRGSDG